MRQYGLGLTVWSPLSFGFLSGKYTRENLGNSEFRLSGFDPLRGDREKGFAAVEGLRAIAQSRGATVAQIALAWLLMDPIVSSVVLGASNLAQREDNIGAMDIVLTPEEIAEINSLMPPPVLYPGWSTEATLKALAIPKAEIKA